MVDLVEAMHSSIARIPAIAAKPPTGRTTGITRLVYRSIRGVASGVGLALDALLARLPRLLIHDATGAKRDALLAALNGVLGDYLAASGNPLEIPMQLRRRGVALTVEREALAAAIPEAGGKLVVLLHGLCMSDTQWNRKGHDHGAALAHDLGYTPVYLNYNSGLHVSQNGRAFSGLLEKLVQQWPAPLTELVLIGYSLGGLVARSACHYGALGHARWTGRLDTMVFIGTPHQGAPLERGGNWVETLLKANAYSAPLARLARIRSAGITDLRFGCLLDEDWQRRDRFARAEDSRAAVPLPKGVACYAIAATTGRRIGDLSDRLIGDGIVPVASALGRHANPQLALQFDEGHRQVVVGSNHLDLLSRPAVYDQLRQWLAASPRQGWRRMGRSKRAL